MTDWAIPQQAKLKYTQLFNLHDRSRSGFLSGLQCRDILLQSGLHRNVLAEIWNLSDIDGDGQLTREEFILAMHLTNQVRAGQNLPNELPPDLIPPSYRRARSISATSVNSATSASSSVSGGGNNDDQVSQKSNESTATAVGSVLNTNSFEDKRRENFEKGRAELERRRLKIIEEQSSIIREQLEARKKQVTEAKAKIDSMRNDRDTKMGLITSLEAQLKTVQDRKAYLHQEELNLIAIAKDLNLVNPAQADLDERATQAKQQSINQMKEKLEEFSREKDKKAKKLADITDQVENSKKDLRDVAEKVKVVYDAYKEEIAKAKVVREQIIDENKSKTVDLDSVWGNDTGFGTPSSFQPEPIQDIKDDPWAAKPDTDSARAFGFEDSQNSMSGSSFSQAFGDIKPDNGVLREAPKQRVRRYRALYPFDARNPDELTINPGDTIVGSGDVCEPGWLSGEIEGRTGLFPEAYVEPLDDEPEIASTTDVESSNTPNQLIESLQKSLTITPPNKYKVLYAFEARNPDELSIEPGDIVTEIEGAHEPEWLCGEVNGRKGLFPESYVEKMPEDQQNQSTENQPGKSRPKKAEVATVIANYRALGQEQLNLEKGQLVLIRRKMDSGWWEGEIQVKEREPGCSELDHLMRELIVSELDYVNDLNLCRLAYMVPLSKSFDVSNIFNCWDHLLDLHEFRLDALVRLPKLDHDVVLGSFRDMLRSSTDLYIDFCSRQTESTKNFDAKLMSDMRFRQLVNECQRNLHKLLNSSQAHPSGLPSSSISNWHYRALSNVKLPLTNFIIKPMQRITKYSLLFTKIFETTTKSSSSNQQLIGLAAEVKSLALDLCELVNDACRRKEDTEHNRRRLAWAQSHIKQSLNHDSSLDLAIVAGMDHEQQVVDSRLVETIIFDSETNCLGDRRLIKAGCFTKLRSGRELILFLFNDILLLAQARGGLVIKAEDVFRSNKAQQSYYKFYKAPILLEYLTLVAPSKNRRASWVEKQSITVSFSDESTGTLYELLAMNPTEKTCWIRELEQASNDARNARALQDESNSLKSTRRFSLTECRGRLFITVLQANMSCIFMNADDLSNDFTDTSLMSLHSKRSIGANPIVGPLVSVQIQLRKKNSYDLLQARHENIPISDAFRTVPRQFNLSHKFATTAFIEDRPKSEYVIEYEDTECTQLLVPQATTNSQSDGTEILDIILMNVSNYSPNRVVARRRVKLDSLVERDHQINGQRMPTGSESQHDQQRLKSGRPADLAFRLRPVDTAARQTLALNRSSSHSAMRQQPQIRCGEDPTFEVKLRFHLQLFCDQDNDSSAIIL